VSGDLISCVQMYEESRLSVCIQDWMIATADSRFSSATCAVGIGKFETEDLKMLRRRKCSSLIQHCCICRRPLSDYML